MATTNYERVGKTMDLLRQGLQPFIERELQAQHGKYWVTTVTTGWPPSRTRADARASPSASGLSSANFMRVVRGQVLADGATGLRRCPK